MRLRIQSRRKPVVLESVLTGFIQGLVSLTWLTCMTGPLKFVAHLSWNIAPLFAVDMQPRSDGQLMGVEHVFAA